MPGDHLLAGIGDEAAVDLPGQLAAIERIGFGGIELRNVDGAALGDLDEQRFRRLRAAVRDAGLAVPCLASRIGNWARPVTAPFADDLRELEVLAARAAELGTRYVRIMSYPNDGLPEAEWRERVLDRVARLAQRADELNVVLLHENCAGWAGRDADRMLRMLAEAGASLRLLFDTGNGIEHGYDACELLGQVVAHVAHVHVKDAVGSAGNATYVLPGTGSARVADCLRLLRDSGYSGALSLEPHLSARPHDGVVAGESAADRFVEAGRRLEGLLRDSMPCAAPRIAGSSGRA